ncbi:MAG: ATPase [Clostridia bacterium]|nr:ATPase [Clostridia bacterium]
MTDLKKTSLGIELGSTRIKAVLIDENHVPVASGSYEWENSLVNGIWTYSLDEVHTGFRSCYADLCRDLKEKYGLRLTNVGAIGVSAMMHGYLPFDKDWRQLCEFRTWRNTITEKAAEKLTELFGFNIPQRWSVAHLYQAILNKEPHVKDVAFVTPLSGYIHNKLTGVYAIGAGEASGLFPVDSDKLDYDEKRVKQFRDLTGIDIRDVFPKVLCAGEVGGILTEEGARFIDPTGTLRPGIPVAPCEGDAGTGMVATNSIRVHTGNVSLGTSGFVMAVTDKQPRVHREIDMITTPDGLPVAMAHCNTCTGDINAWVNLFYEFCSLIGADIDKGEMFVRLFRKALDGDPDCGGLLSYNYLSGEGATGLNEGRPLFMRAPNAEFTLANFMRTHLYSALATLRFGMDILTGEENVKVEKLYGHGGFFKTPTVGQYMLSAAFNVPVSVTRTAGEGGPYGMALLAAYMLNKKDGESLPDYLDNRVFSGADSVTVSADKADVDGFNAFFERYKKAFETERKAAEVF